MAKQSYKIPDSLAKNWYDTQISLSTKNSQLPPLPVKIIFGFLGAFFFCLWLVFASFVKYSSIPVQVLLVLLIMGLTSLVLVPDATGNSKYSLVPALLDYMQADNRKIIVRSTKPANNFMHVSGINNVDPKHGYIKFTDGGYGYAYRVVGSASILLFEEDKTAVLDRVDNYYRNMKAEYEQIYITSKEAQHVEAQLRSLKERYQNLNNHDKDLDAIANMEYRILRDEIGQHFKSIHQYLIIRASNPESLTLGKNMLISEVQDGRGLMFKQAQALFGDDLIDMLASIYKGKESV